MSTASRRAKTPSKPSRLREPALPIQDLTIRREVVLETLNETLRILERDDSKTRRSAIARLSLRSPSEWPRQRDELVGKLQRAQESLRSESLVAAARGIRRELPDEPYLPRNRAVALLQTAMDEFLEKQARTRTAKTRLASRAPERFDPTDPGWITVALERLRLLFTRNARFISHKSVTDFRFELKPQARIALVGDWGTGTANAQAVARQIQAQNPDHIIHLGDVYYSGTKEEIEKRFLSILRDLQLPASLWALNSNHEMYSGGHGYFQSTLKEFRQPASYFSLGNSDWRLIGLDTGYVDHNLNREQVEWLDAQLNNGAPKTILLTHHQLFSAYEGQGAKLEEKVRPHLDAGRIFAWFWGHEHACIIYDTFKNIQGRCIGNGGIPYSLPPAEPENQGIPVKFVDRRPRPDNPGRGLHGFALLTVDGQQLHVDYIDQNGDKAAQEDF